MSAISLVDAQYMLDLYLRAERDILQFGQSTAIQDKRLTRADLEQIVASRRSWERKVSDLQAGNGGGPLGRVMYGVPR